MRVGRRRTPIWSADSYGPLMLLIAGTYVIGTVADHRWTISLLLFAQIGTVWYALRISRAHTSLRVLATLIFALSLIAGGWNMFAHGRTLIGLVFFAGSVLYVVAPLSIVGDLGRRHHVDRELMMGALATYLMLGMAFAFAYRCIAAFQPSPFYGAQGDGTLADSLFYSFVTLTTTGYGNLVPAGNPGQTLAVLEALLGQLFLVTAVAKIVNVWSPRGWRNKSHSPGMAPGAPEETTVAPSDRDNSRSIEE
ncbi:potassium channel family protein [Actinoplanes sp. CA-030573]|uniref:potassium channel family protein n=1 Tax=Actinoplanes sp. CA-030573 TaxID=3239898 RepID=UPI003D925E26